MAEAAQKPADEQKLKYLGFVLVVVIHLFMLASKLYALLKEKLGPLKPGINAVENTVKSIVVPVWGKFDNVPIDCLKFVDSKIDRSVKRVQRRVPKALKRVSRRAFKSAKKAPVAARSVMSDVNTTTNGMVESASELVQSVYDKCEPVAKDIYAKCEPVTEQCASSAWHFFNQNALVHRAVKNLHPIASHLSGMYNEKVQGAAEKENNGNVEAVAEATREEAVATK